MKPSLWVGYCEHLTPDELNIFNANVGKGGCTIFAEILKQTQGVDLQGLPWCATFVHATLGRPDLLGKADGWSWVLQWRMKLRRRWRGRYYRPQPNDLMFCANDHKWVDHVCIVESCDGTTVTTIDGNTHDENGRFAWTEGGVVARRTRDLTDPLIIGYGAIGKDINIKTTDKEVAHGL